MGEGIKFMTSQDLPTFLVLSIFLGSVEIVPNNPWTITEPQTSHIVLQLGDGVQESLRMIREEIDPLGLRFLESATGPERQAMIDKILDAEEALIRAHGKVRESNGTF
jgi:hypothetical protein